MTHLRALSGHLQHYPRTLTLSPTSLLAHSPITEPDVTLKSLSLLYLDLSFLYVSTNTSKLFSKIISLLENELFVQIHVTSH
jgi:hypothetical protein